MGHCCSKYCISLEERTRQAEWISNRLTNSLCNTFILRLTMCDIGMSMGSFLDQEIPLNEYQYFKSSTCIQKISIKELISMHIYRRIQQTIYPYTHLLTQDDDYTNRRKNFVSDTIGSHMVWTFNQLYELNWETFQDSLCKHYPTIALRKQKLATHIISSVCLFSDKIFHGAFEMVKKRDKLENELPRHLAALEISAINYCAVVKKQEYDDEGQIKKK